MSAVVPGTARVRKRVSPHVHQLFGAREKEPDARDGFRFGGDAEGARLGIGPQGGGAAEVRMGVPRTDQAPSG